jgi:hypothetical protein
LAKALKHVQWRIGVEEKRDADALNIGAALTLTTNEVDPMVKGEREAIMSRVRQ